MQLGRHLHELCRMRIGFALSVLLGLIAALMSVGTIGLFPPALKERPLETAAATTRVLVDTPTSSVIDLRVPTGDLESITNRALLVANVMASAPVREYVAERARVPGGVIKVASPVTRDFPRQLAQSGNPRRVSDILASPDQYRLSLRANPTVPVIDIYSQAPTAEAARNLADGAVAGMSDYLRDLGARQGVPAFEQVRLEQLGRARGGMVTEHVGVTVAILAFVLVFAGSSIAVLLLGRVRQGWATQQRYARAQRAA